MSNFRKMFAEAVLTPPMARLPPLPRMLGLLAGLVALAGVFVATDAARAATSEWAAAHAGRARLIAGGGASGQPLAAGVEIELADGWKTYWRHPGDAGGVPPNFDWSGSRNATASVLYPAPKRMTDKAGDTIGYKGSVVFPVTLAVADSGQPVALRLKLEYGICREICVPAEAVLALDIPAGGAGPLPEQLAQSLLRVPRPAQAASLAPLVVSQQLTLTGDKPAIAFVAQYPGGADHADAFAEVSDGLAVPLPRKDGPVRDRQLQAFVIDLTPADVADLKGRTLTLTLVGDAGQSEVLIALP